MPVWRRRKGGAKKLKEMWSAFLPGVIILAYDIYYLTTGSREVPFLNSGFRMVVFSVIIMVVVMILMRLFDSRSATRFHWSWAIPMISILLTAADMAYFVALSDTDAMISVVSMIRRGSVVVSFACGALLFRERNLKAKALDLALIIIGMVFLYFGSR